MGVAAVTIAQVLTQFCVMVLFFLISGINLFFAFAVMTINLFIDLLYSYLDPRIQYK